MFLDEGVKLYEDVEQNHNVQTPNLSIPNFAHLRIAH